MRPARYERGLRRVARCDICHHSDVLFTCSQRFVRIPFSPLLHLRSGRLDVACDCGVQCDATMTSSLIPVGSGPSPIFLADHLMAPLYFRLLRVSFNMVL